MQSALGVVAIIALAFIISENRRAVPWRSVIIGLILTFALALLMLKIPQAEIAFGWINRVVEVVAAATKAGTTFVFGYVGGGAPPFDPKTPGSDFILAFQALPVVLVMSVLSSLLCRSCAASHGRWSARSTSAARPVSLPRPTFLSARSRRPCSSGPISKSCRAAKCSS
jgi:ABC-type phosphate/phosphonate transport system permease subunit